MILDKLDDRNLTSF